MRRAAVIGCGRMGAFTSESVRRFAPPCWFPLSHADAIAAHPGLTLSGLCDANPAGLARAVLAHGAPGFGDLGALLAAGAPDLLCIATRTPGRAGIVAEAAAAGVRAFHVEKPLCNTLAELEGLEALFADGERFLTLGAIRRFFPVYRNAVSIAASGELGALLEIRVGMGLGKLYWTHPHSVDLILFAAQGRELGAVQAVLRDLVEDGATGHVGSDPVVDSATLVFADGLVGQIGRAGGGDFILACERGQVAVLNDGRELVVARCAGDDPYPAWSRIADDRLAADQGCGTLGAIAQLADCLGGDATARAANAAVRADIFTGQRALFAMVESMRRNSALTPLVDLDPAIAIWARSGDLSA